MLDPPVVAMGLKSPAFLEPGFGSHVSICVGPPPIHSMMTAFAVRPEACLGWVACARSLCGRDDATAPPAPARLNRRKLRRLKPGVHFSQFIILFPSNFLSKLTVIYSTRAGSMAGDEFRRIEERPVRVLPVGPGAAQERPVALLLAVGRRTGEGGQEHRIDLVLDRARGALDLLD